MNPKFLDEAESRFNEIALNADQVCRIIGYMEDENDYYLIVRYMRGRIGYVSFCSSPISLYPLIGKNERKSFISQEVWDDYYRVSSILKLNGCPEEEEFIVDEFPFTVSSKWDKVFP